MARRKEPLDEVAGRCRGNALPVVADVTRRADVRRVVEEALAKFGRIDVWVNNVGQGITPHAVGAHRRRCGCDDPGQCEVSALWDPGSAARRTSRDAATATSSTCRPCSAACLDVIRSAYCGAKHFLNALTATLREELQQSHPGIAVSIVSPPVVRTDFGLNALHGGPDSRQFPMSQSPEEVAEVIASVIESRIPDAYTMPGSRERVADYYAQLGADPPA